ncbi:MAG: hypothetical protein WB383_05600 [Acidimicrobiales bacterium]
MTVVVLTNTGPTCRLGGYPKLIGISPTGGEVRLIARQYRTYFGNLIPADLRKGQSGELLLGTSNGCNAFNQPSQAAVERIVKAHTYDEVVIILPTGEGSVTASTYPFDTACGFDESELGVSRPPPVTEAPAPGSPGSLTATVNLPPTARSGEVLGYTVSLHNPTDSAVDLHHCPDYTEGVYYPFKRPTIRTYTLNCARARPIDPGQTRVFAMELPTPKVTKPTMAKFSWELDTGLGPFSGSALQVVPATDVDSAAAVSSHSSGGLLGHVTGRLMRVGGPAPGAAVGIPGRVVLSLVGTSGSFTHATGPNGTFNVLLPAGFTYRVTGYSPKVFDNGGEELCAAGHRVRVPSRAGSDRSIVVRAIEVVCPIR